MSEQLYEVIYRLEQIINEQSIKIDKLVETINSLQYNQISSDTQELDLSDYRLENTVEEYYTLDLFKTGEEGLIKFIVDYIVYNDNNLLYRCMDLTKASFVYIEDGKIRTDCRCKNLLDSLQPHIIRQATRHYKSIINRIYSTNDNDNEDDDESEDDDIIYLS